MKRLHHILFIFIVSIFLTSCQKEFDLDLELDIDIMKDDDESIAFMQFGYEEIMTVTDKSYNPQGGDCWGDYFFQFTADNVFVRVYDLATKSLVQRIWLLRPQQGFVSGCHCNTVCFGTEFYAPEDQFPLIYVSTGYAADGYTGALVYRITQNDKGIFSISLVQTLKFPVDKSSWTEFVPAGEFAYLCYTSERVIFKVPMPKLKDGDVIIDRKSAIETYQFTPQPDWMRSSRNQDRLFYQGKIVFVSGVPPGEASVFVILNLEKREREVIVDFKKYGLNSEPESIFVWRGDLCVAFVDRIVKLNLN